MTKLNDDGDFPVEAVPVAKDHSYAANMAKVDGRIAELEAALRPSPQRAQFDTALNGLLIRENLDGAAWALGQILDEAKILEGGPGLADPAVAEYLRMLVEKVNGALDKRTAELSTRHRGD
ncbi:hypothetical protein [Streptomyces sp. NPDC058252]|uniref:hypothetical protein n=1 Tax=Streptomyces sp. NPDC058252 TaxID=3346405 RepID=UPI0036EA5986